jgi:hypothetical protein
MCCCLCCYVVLKAHELGYQACLVAGRIRLLSPTGFTRESVDQLARDLGVAKVFTDIMCEWPPKSPPKIPAQRGLASQPRAKVEAEEFEVTLRPATSNMIPLEPNSVFSALCKTSETIGGKLKYIGAAQDAQTYRFATKSKELYDNIINECITFIGGAIGEFIATSEAHETTFQPLEWNGTEYQTPSWAKRV